MSPRGEIEPPGDDAVSGAINAHEKCAIAPSAETKHS